MATLQQRLAEIDALRRGGNAGEAERRCRDVLVDDDAPAAWNLLGLIVAAQGRVDEAAQCFQRALALAPPFAQAAHNLGVACEQLGRLNEAAEALRRAIGLEPGYAAAHANLGVVLEKLCRLDEAAASCVRAIELKPDLAAAHNALGTVLVRLGRLPEAAESFRQAARWQPGCVEAHANLAAVLERQGHLYEADAAIQAALALDPHRAATYVNAALVLEKQGRLNEALEAAERAITLDAQSADAQVNLGLVLERLGRMDQSLAAFRRAVDLDAANAEAHLNLGLALLRREEFAAGWPHYEWRLEIEGVRAPAYDRPRWRGESIHGRTIHLAAEQGFGDAIQFVRFARVLKSRGARVLVECRPALASLLATCPGVDEVVVAGEQPPEFDVYAPLASVPGALATTLATIPTEVPYLFPNAGLVDAWAARLGDEGGRLKVGIAWQGNPAFKSDRYRSIPLECFLPLVEVPGVRLVSLQWGPGREQLDELPDRGSIVDLPQRSGTFEETAAIMQNLDLMIVSDSAPAHLAGAIGVPVWVALGLVADWRWLERRDDCPWYPTMRLYRQQRWGDWTGVFARIAADLAVLASR